MIARSFATAGWSASILAALANHGCDGIEISGVSAKENGATGEALASLLGVVRSVFHAKQVWVIAGHNVPQPNTRIVKHQKLWNSLGLATKTFSENQAVEWMQATDAGVRFFGILDKVLVSDDSLFKLWKTSSCWLAVLKSKRPIEDLKEELLSGWSDTPQVLPDLLLRLAGKGNVLLIRDFGPTETSEEGIIAIAESGSIKQIESLLNGSGVPAK